MKTLYVSLILTLAALSLFAASTTNAPNVTFQWQYPTTPTNVAAFVLLGTTNLSQPSNSWPVVTSWTTWGVTNIGGQVYYTASVYAAPSAYFFTITASNFWGSSPQSNAVSVPPPAQTPQSISLSYTGP